MIVTGWWWKSFKSRRRYTYSTLEETVIRAGIQEAANVDVVFGFVDEHDDPSRDKVYFFWYQMKYPKLHLYLT